MQKEELPETQPIKLANIFIKGAHHNVDKKRTIESSRMDMMEEDEPPLFDFKYIHNQIDAQLKQGG